MLTTIQIIVILLVVCIVESILFTASARTYNNVLKIIGFVLFGLLLIATFAFFISHGYIIV